MNTYKKALLVSSLLAGTCGFTFSMDPHQVYQEKKAEYERLRKLKDKLEDLKSKLKEYQADNSYKDYLHLKAHGTPTVSCTNSKLCEFCHKNGLIDDKLRATHKNKLKTEYKRIKTAIKNANQEITTITTQHSALDDELDAAKNAVPSYVGLVANDVYGAAINTAPARVTKSLFNAAKNAVGDAFNGVRHSLDTISVSLETGLLQPAAQAEQVRTAIQHSDLGLALMKVNLTGSDKKQIRTMIELIHKMKTQPTDIKVPDVESLINSSLQKHQEIMDLAAKAMQKSFAELDGKTLDKALVGQTDAQAVGLITKRYQQHIKTIFDKWIAENNQKVIKKYATTMNSRVVSEDKEAAQKRDAEIQKFKEQYLMYADCLTKAMDMYKDSLTAKTILEKMFGLKGQFATELAFNKVFETRKKAFDTSLTVSPIEVDVIDIKGDRYAEAFITIRKNLEKDKQKDVDVKNTIDNYKGKLNTVVTSFNNLFDAMTGLTTGCTNSFDVAYAKAYESEEELAATLKRVVVNHANFEHLTDAQRAAFEKAKAECVPFYIKFKAYDVLSGKTTAKISKKLVQHDTIAKGLANLPNLENVDERLKDVDLGMLKFKRKKALLKLLPDFENSASALIEWAEAQQESSRQDLQSYFDLLEHIEGITIGTSTQSFAKHFEAAVQDMQSIRSRAYEKHLCRSLDELAKAAKAAVEDKDLIQEQSDALVKVIDDVIAYQKNWLKVEVIASWYKASAAGLVKAAELKASKELRHKAAGVVLKNAIKFGSYAQSIIKKHMDSK